MSRGNLSTTETRGAARDLLPLVRETRAAIGDIARHGAKVLDALSADKGSPLTISTGLALSGHGPFPSRHKIRTVSPKINADRTLDGYSGLRVVSANTRNNVRQHYFKNLISPYDPHRLACLTLPFTKSEEELTIEVSSQDEPAPSGSWIPEFRAGVITNGVATIRSYEGYPEPEVPTSKRASPEEFRAMCFQVYPESLAISGLVARGLRAYEMSIDTKPAQALYDDWQKLQGLEPAASDTFWTAINNDYLEQHLL